MTTMTSEVRIYVGTYAKYNNGSIEGKWLDASDYSDYDEFLEACKELHSDEHDPEFMFQDYEGPDMFYSESGISPELWDYLEAIKDFDEDRIEALNIFMNNERMQFDSDTIEKFESAYRGQFDSERHFAEDEADQMGYYDAMDKAGINRYYFDEEAFARDLFMGDYWMRDGHVFSSSY